MPGVPVRLRIRVFLFCVAVVPDNPEVEQHIFKYLPLANVVYDQRPWPIVRLYAGHNADMGNSTSQVPANDVSSLVVGRILCKRQRRSIPAKERHEVWHPPVVYVFVGP